MMDQNLVNRQLKLGDESKTEGRSQNRKLSRDNEKGFSRTLKGAQRRPAQNDPQHNAVCIEHKELERTHSL